jgi:hypothetical protein
MQSFPSLFALLALAWPYFLTVQEVKYIDMSNVHLRTELRHPPASPPECKEGSCIGGESGGVSVGDGAADQRDPHALGVYLLHVTPTEIRPAEPFEAEFKVTNTGRVPIEVPVNPHLSDLQPSDESVAFSYLSLALVVRGEGDPRGQGQNVPAFGFVELYGSHEHDGSIVELRPAEWIRIRATVKLSTWPLKPVFARLRGSFWLRRNTFRPQSGGAFTEIQNLYPNATPTPSIPVHLLSPVPPGNPKQ